MIGRVWRMAGAAIVLVSSIAMASGAWGQTAPNEVTMHVTCTSTGEVCAPAFSVTITSHHEGIPITLTNTSACAPIDIRVAKDDGTGENQHTGPLAFKGGPGSSSKQLVLTNNDVAPVGHTYFFQAVGVGQGCDTGHLASWEAVFSVPAEFTIGETSDHAPPFVKDAAAPATTSTTVGAVSGAGPAISTGPVTATFATLSSNASEFDADPVRTRPAFTRKFPVINFNPASEIELGCTNKVDVNVNTRPLTDVVRQSNGRCTTIPAEGNGHRMGVGPDEAFEIAFVGTLRADRAGDSTLSFFSDDGVMLGIGRGSAGQPTRVSGVLNNPLEATALKQFPIVGSNNQITPATEEDFTVHFPGAGTYPFELDYFEGAGGQLTVSLTSKTSLLGSFGTSASTGFAASLATPSDLSTSLRHLATNVLVAATFGFLIAFPAELFDTTLAEHYEEVNGFFGRVLAPFRRDGALLSALRINTLPAAAVFVGMLALSALLYGLLDPGFGFNGHSVVLFVGLLVGLAMVTAVFTLPRLVQMRIAHGEWGRPRAFLGALPIALACVLLSRLAHFNPGYLYGAIAGFAFQSEVAPDEEGRLVALSSAWILVVSVAAWLARSPLRASAEGADAGFLAQIVDVALVTVFVAGLEGLLIGLLPMRFLDGERLRAWNKKVWYVLFGLALLGFVAILLNPTGSYLAHGSGPAVLTALLLFLAFGAVSVSFWAWFRFRDSRSAAVE